MVIDMNETRLNTVAQLRAFLNGTAAVQFQPGRNDVQRYDFIATVLKRFAYRRLRRRDKAVVLRYLERTTGYSRQQITRLVRRDRDGTTLAKRYRAPRAGFARKFGTADVKLLAQTDALHGTLSGPATKRLLQRAWQLFGDPRYERLASLSVAHLYTPRRPAASPPTRLPWTKPRGPSMPTADRPPPHPQRRPRL